MPTVRSLLSLVTVSLLILFSGAPALSAAPSTRRHAPACPGGGKDAARCHARFVAEDNGQPQVTAGPAGYGPAELQAAYGLAGLRSGNRILAVVDAYDHPGIQSDLDIYSRQFGLPVLQPCPLPFSKDAPGACFLKVNQAGQAGPYPRSDAGWALEIALDVEVAHGICPDCKILLVEADGPELAYLAAAVNTAVAMGATAVSNSYGANEFAGETRFDSTFDRTGVAFTASSGDSGYGVSYPAASRFVTAVGGTTLTPDGAGAFSEVAWSGAGSGCSRYQAKPRWQKDRGCPNRTVADVSAVADPATGAAIYNSVPIGNSSGWFQVGGTSLAAPIVAGAYVLGGVPAGRRAAAANSLPYSRQARLHDVTGGSNCSPQECGALSAYLWQAVGGYDGPTGLGTPDGTSGF